MNLRELHLRVSEMVKHLREYQDPEVRIITNDPSMGARSSVGVQSVCHGIDHEGGTVCITTLETITKKQKK